MKLTDRRKQLTCKQCGKSFIAYISSKRKFCSRACSDKHHAIHLNSGVFKKGHSRPWTPTQHVKMLKILKGRKVPWLKEALKNRNQSGVKNPNYKHGLTHSNKCVDCGKRIWFSFVRCKSCANKGKNNPRYIDGRTRFEHSLRNLREYKAWKELALQRDKGTCQECGSGNEIEVHHKIPFSVLCDRFLASYKRLELPENKKSELVKWYHPLWDIDNGITLCLNCHKKLDAKRRQFYG